MLPRPLVGWGGGYPSPPLSSSLASSFRVGPRRCEVRRAHQMVNPALRVANHLDCTIRPTLCSLR